MTTTSHNYLDPIFETFQKFQNEFTSEQLERFKSTTSKDVRNTIGTIQTLKESRREMTNMNRLKSFLEAMDQFERITEASPDTANHMALVWGPFKFILQTSSTSLAPFDVLLDAYERISEKIPLLLQFQLLFNAYPAMRTVLELLYKDILEFHRWAVGLLNRPIWREVFRSMWNDFMIRFESILGNLGRYKTLIEDQAALLNGALPPPVVFDPNYVAGGNIGPTEAKNGAAHIGDQHCSSHFPTDSQPQHEADQAQVQRNLAVLGRSLEIARLLLERQERDRQYRQYWSVREWIAGPSMANSHIAACAVHSKYPETGLWVLEHEKVASWMNDDLPRKPILWMHGIPGAGKTVLASVIIEACTQVRESDTTYFYCKYDDPETNTSMSILKAILMQEIHSRRDLVPYFYERQQLSNEPELSREYEARRLVKTVCHVGRRKYIILDGVDECSPMHRRSILSWFSSLVQDFDQIQPSKIRLLVVTQTENDIRRALINADEFQIQPKDNCDDIKFYVSQWAEKIQSKFNLNTEEEHFIEQRTCQQAAGQFLYAKSVMENLYAQHTLMDLRNELETPAFPKKLSEAYERIIVRIRTNITDIEWSRAKTLLGWMTCAVRPLKWHEIQGAISIHLHDFVYFDTGQLLHVKDICGALVGKAGKRVSLVCSTAKQFISESEHFDVPIVECEMASLCMQYLSFSCFDPQVTDDALYAYIMDGYFAFADYAVAKWMHHFRRVLDYAKTLSNAHLLQSREVKIQELCEAAEVFTHTYEVDLLKSQYNAQARNISPQLTSQTRELLADFTGAERCFQLLWLHAQSYCYQDTRARNTISLERLHIAMERIRNTLETIYTASAISNKDKANLTAFYGDRIFKCSELTCYFFHEGFKTREERDRHVSRHARPYQCDQPDCSSADCGFSSKRDLENHMLSFHPDMEMKANPSKRTAPKPNNTEWGCSKCDKTFARRGNLNRHELAHSYHKPYECSRCGKAFVRKNDCTRHEKTHEMSHEIHRSDEAENLLVQEMETRKKELGVDHSDALTSIINLPSMYRDQGRLGEAEKLGARPPTDLNPAPTDSGYASMAMTKAQPGGNISESAAAPGASAADDAATVYTNDGVKTIQMEELIQDFAQHLFADLRIERLNLGLYKQLFLDLEEVLADFSLRLVQADSSVELREAMRFIHKHRRDLSTSFKDRVTRFVAYDGRDKQAEKANDLEERVDHNDDEEVEEEEDEEEEDGEENSNENEGEQNRFPGVVMSVSEKLKMWNVGTSDTAAPQEAQAQDSEPQSAIQSEEKSYGSGVFEKLKNTVLRAPSYEWLLATLRNKLLLTTTSGDVQRGIRSEVLKALPKPRVFQRAATTPSNQAIFDLDCQLNLADLGSGSIELGSVVTVTGSAYDAQALTCSEYIQQTWPVTGIFVMQLLGKVLMLDSGQVATCQRPDGTNMAAWRHDTMIKVKVSGARGIIAEVAEQLCWMTAALCLSPISERLISCSPSIHYVGQSEDLTGVSKMTVKPGGLTYDKSTVQSLSSSDYTLHENMSTHFQITLHHNRLAYDAEPGSCWHYLFKHCVIVNGFPIRQRPKPSLGLEIPLSVVAELIGTKYLHDFTGHMFLKGFFIMLAPAEQADNVLIWHLCRSNTEDRISYLDHGLPQLCKINLNDLVKRRHIIGWCSNIRNYCGTADGNYEVESSVLATIASNGVLHNCKMLFGNAITDGIDFTLTANSQPISTSGKTHLEMLRYLERQFVLFLDTRDHRGWLINGLRALLHLVRQSLKVDKEDGGELFVMNQEDLKEPEHPYSAKAAREFLTNPRNLSTKITISSIRECQQEYEVLADRIKQFYDVIEKGLDYQRQCRIWAKIPRSQLEGWDFISLARKEDPIKPSMFMLPSMGKSWVDLVRAVGAVSFFGEGFGEMLKPEAHTCTPLPCSKFYMAIATSDIRKIMAMNRCDPRSTPRLINRSPSIIWHSPIGSLGPCGCEMINGSKANHNIVQVMWLKDFASLLPESSEMLDLEKHASGAIAFGHSDTIQYYVADAGPPISGAPPDPGPELKMFEDSGIGSSLHETVEETLSTATALPIHDPAAATSTTSESCVQSQRTVRYGPASFQECNAHLGNTYYQFYLSATPEAAQPSTTSPHASDNQEFADLTPPRKRLRSR